MQNSWHSEAGKHAIWMRSPYEELGLELQKVSLLGDNEARLMVAQNKKSSTKTKHIRLRFHALKEYIEQGSASR